MRRGRRLPSLVATLLLAACSDASAPTPNPLDPWLPPDVVPLAPPAVYDVWWQMVSDCADLPAPAEPPEPIKWYQIPDVWVFPYGAEEYAGLWFSTRQIVVAGNRVHDGRLVRHEMLHDALFGGGHPRSPYVRQCGGVVVCAGNCLDDEPPEPPGPIVVTADDVDVTLEIWPPQPSPDLLGGYLRLAVTVTNTTGLWVAVDVPSINGDTARISGYTREGPDGTFASRLHAFNAPELAWFMPDETRRYFYDLWIGGAPFLDPIPPGQATFRGMFAGRWTDPITVTIPAGPAARR